MTKSPLDSFREKITIIEIPTNDTQNNYPDPTDLLDAINEKFGLDLSIDVFDGSYDEESDALWKLSVSENDSEVVERLRKNLEQMKRRQEVIEKLLKENSH